MQRNVRAGRLLKELEDAMLLPGFNTVAATIIKDV